MHFKETQYGFEWGAATVQRLTSDDARGWVLLGIITPKMAGMQVYVTKTGKVRVFGGDGREWVVPKSKAEDTTC